VNTFWLAGTIGPEGKLVFTSPDWTIVLCAVAAGLAFVAAMLGPRSLSSRLVEMLCWGLSLAGLVLALAGPVWVEEEGRTEPGRTIVLVDASRSMGVREEGKARSDSVPAILEHIRKEVDEVEIFHFGDELTVGEPTTFDLPGTDLDGALGALGERVAGERLAGVVLVTDGIDRGLLRRRFENEEAPSPPEVAGPLTVFQVGTRTDVLDLSVRSIDTGGYAFIRAPFAITADIEGVGYGQRSVPVTLLRDGATVTEQRVVLDSNGRATVRFEVTAEDAGRFAYAVSVPIYEGDAVPANNTMPVVVKVVRDRIRVLQVAGAPSWDVKFMRRFLKDDPSVQLVSFFILRTQRDLASQYSDRELSLIQFPYERLFADDLWSFDVVIFQNFDYQPYFQFNSGVLLENLRKYVQEGGALVMVGGDRSFSLGRYGGTALADALPVEIGLQEEQPDLAPFLPQLTAEGARHPITRLVAEAEENATWWSRLHTLDGTNVVMRAKPDAAVLLAHPTRMDADGKPLPILSVREVGAGRTMALTVDSSWRWSLSEAAVGRGNQVYLRFWKNALRWLMKDSTVARVTVETPRENYAVGEEVRIVVRARDPGFAPLPGAKVAAEVDNEGRTSKLEGRTSADGDLVLVMPADHSGTHRVKVKVTTAKDEPVGEADTVFAVTTRDPEVDEIAPDENFLRWLASSTDGVYHAPGDLGVISIDPEAGRVVNERRETPLWRAPLLALWIGLFAGVAFFIRRRSGLR
jgi:uncharacterized membrane protein